MLVQRHAAWEELWSRASTKEEALALGATVLVQTQRGPNKVRWETSGTVADILEPSSYLVTIDGSGRLSKQRHSFLKPMVAHRDVLVRPSSESSGLDMGMSLF